MERTLVGKRIAFLVADGVERDDVQVLKTELEKAGANVELVAASDAQEVSTVRGLDRAEPLPVHRTVDEVEVIDFDGLVIPGGSVSVDTLRISSEAVNLIRDFVHAQDPSDKLVAAVGLGPRLLVEAGVVSGRVLAGAPSLQTDARNAGGAYVEDDVKVDGCLITGRGGDALPELAKRLVSAFAAGQAPGAAAAAGHANVPPAKLDEMVEETFPASDSLPPPTRS